MLTSEFQKSCSVGISLFFWIVALASIRHGRSKRIADDVSQGESSSSYYEAETNDSVARALRPLLGSKKSPLHQNRKSHQELKAIKSLLVATGPRCRGWQNIQPCRRISRHAFPADRMKPQPISTPIISHVSPSSLIRTRDKIMSMQTVSSISALSLERHSDVLDALSDVSDMTFIDHENPSKSSDIVSMGFVKNVEVSDDSGNVSLEIELPVDKVLAGARARLVDRCKEILLAKLEWIDEVSISVSLEDRSEMPMDTSPLQQLALSNSDTEVASDESKGKADTDEPGVASVKNIVAVASCKGGVGKSTTAVNLAYALSAMGKRVGIVDLDIYGASLPTMVRPEGELLIKGESLLPLEAHGVKLMSMGFINPGVMPMRGAKVTPVVQQLVGRTVWGELDYLIVDMPPGTGDVQLTLSQDFQVSAAVLVTTPQRLSFVDVVKGVEMFDTVGIPTVAVVENMDGVVLDDLNSEVEAIIARHALAEEPAADLRKLVAKPQKVFGESHVPRLKEMWGISASFSLPLLPEVAASADSGVPLVVKSPGSEAASFYTTLAKEVDKEVSSLETLQLPQLMYSGEQHLVLIALPDGSMQSISPADLRKQCRSPTNSLENLPDDLRPLDIGPTGNYAVMVRWSDGHQSLIPYRSFINE